MKAGDDLLVRLDELRRRYRAQVSDYLRRIDSDDEKRVLEAHTREWFLDQLLVVFGWSGGTLAPEFPAEGQSASDRRWHMDYLGHAHLDKDVLPLLIVEAKRPEETLPDPHAVGTVPSYYDVRLFLLDGLCGHRQLPGDWHKWLLKQCAGYVSRVHAQHGQYPRGVCLTNGDWFVIFTDPEAAFVTRSPSLDSVIVIPDWASFCRAISQVREHLEVDRLLDGVLPHKAQSAVSLADLVMQDGGAVKSVRGLRLNFATELGWDAGDLPEINMVPVVFIKSAKGRWLYAEGDSTNGAERLPRADGAIPAHLATVEKLANRLMAELSGVLVVPNPTELGEHLRDPADRALVPPVRKIPSKDGISRFLLATGRSSHFLKLETIRSAACSFHDHGRCPADLRAPAPGIRSVSKKSFFKAGEPHGCGHLRARELRGSSRGRANSAVCHIYAFETSMCCRTCVFEDSCFSHVTLNDHMPCEG